MPSDAATLTAATCNRDDVWAKLQAAQAGDTVQIPEGICHWSNEIFFEAPPNFTLQGQTVCTGSGDPARHDLVCTDKTVIIDDYASNHSLLTIVANATGSFRFTGLTFRPGTAPVHDHGILAFSGDSHAFRIDHSHFDLAAGPGPQGTMTLYTWINGVIDHNLFDLPNGPGNGIKIWAADYGGKPNGDGAWSAPTGLGTSDFVFVEENVFNAGYGTDSNDCQVSGRFVWRFNTTGGVQAHSTGSSGRGRGCRAWEVYKNAFVDISGDPQYAAWYATSGTGVVWGNSGSGGNGFKNFIILVDNRRNNSTYPQGATPNGWGYCGTSFNGTGSNWDGNSPSAITGYPCLDQPGRGAGDLLSGEFPDLINSVTGCNSSQPCAYPRQALEPMYEWLNTWTDPHWSGAYLANANADVMQENRDYYLCKDSTENPGQGNCSGFNGSVGIGSGPRASRPATCTTGVAYWAIDEGEWNSTQAGSDGRLYKCTAPNTWTLIYTPYTYPHPLATGTPPPSNRCDLNSDANVNALDLQAEVNAILTATGGSAYDLDRNGQSNAVDVQLLANVVLGIRPCP